MNSCYLACSRYQRCRAFAFHGVSQKCWVYTDEITCRPAYVEHGATYFRFTSCGMFDHLISQRHEAHYTDVIMTTIASQITSLTVVYSTVYSDADQSKHQSSASLAFVWGIHWDRWIPRTKGQLRGKCFHLMTSSCTMFIWSGVIVNFNRTLSTASVVVFMAHYLTSMLST